MSPAKWTLEEYERGRLYVIGYVNNDRDIIKRVMSWPHSNYRPHYDALGNLPYIIGKKPRLDANGMPVLNDKGRPVIDNVPLERWRWEAFNGPVEEGFSIDHINRWRHDNRFENLRKATDKEQLENRRTDRHTMPAHDPDGLTAWDFHVPTLRSPETATRPLTHGVSYVDNVLMRRFMPNNAESNDFDEGLLVHAVTSMLFQRLSRQQIYQRIDADQSSIDAAIARACETLRWIPDFL